MGKLDKQTFKDFVETECERQLFLLLGENDPRWMQPLRALEPRRKEKTAEFGVLDLGHEYEQGVYQALIRSPNTRYDRSPSGEVLHTSLTPKTLLGMHAALRSDTKTTLCLLEHQWIVPEAFVGGLFGLGLEDASPVMEPPQRMRPDILLLSRESQSAQEVLPDGRIVSVSAEQLTRRVGIQVIDIKHTNEHNVGKKHFVELIWYVRALSAYLVEHGLYERFFVQVKGHGIFPQVDQQALYGLTPQTLAQHSIELPWHDTIHVFDRACERLQKLWKQTPLAIEATPVSIQPACGRCGFLEDCKKTLGVVDGASPDTWDVRLLPYTSRSIAEQLRQHQLYTVKDIKDKIMSLSLGDTPAPLYAEQPLLSLKANSLSQGKALATAPEYTGGQRHLSIALPRFTNLELMFDVETDTSNEVVFAAGLYFRVSIAPSAAFYQVNLRWWQAWRSLFAAHKNVREVDLKVAQDTLDAEFLTKTGLYETPPSDKQQKELSALLKTFAESFWWLSTHGNFLIKLPGEQHEGKALSALLVYYRYAYVSSGVETKHERKLAENVVERLNHILTMCHVIETLAGALVTWGDKKIPVSPTFAGFYWSSDQLQHIQDLLERHLTALIDHATLRSHLLQLLNWLAPSESSVTHFEQHKKIFDLKEFIETTLGLPHIINYTWHEISSREQGASFDRTYWAPHFNFMDFAPWHAFLKEDDTSAKGKRVQQIEEQLLTKLQAIYFIFKTYRKEAQDAIAESSKNPVATKQIRANVMGDDYHALARVWFLYSKLNAAISDLEADKSRTTYPAYSIGKLIAGEVQTLSYSPTQGKLGTFYFELQGMSSNMKIGEDDRLLLMPEEQRGDSRIEQFVVIIEGVRWDSQKKCYQITAAPSERWPHPITKGILKPEEHSWYLYPTSGDPWSGKLYENKTSLLKRCNLGTSWLGSRLAFLWGIGSDTSVEKPPSMTFELPELYLFAPQLLPSVTPNLSAPLQTKVSPPPDPSQQEAIHRVLSSTLTCLQGPPGTGKSQTITALIDEFILSARRPVRVLVTAFSYAAMEVVLDKVRTSKYANSTDSAAAKTQLVFLGSSSREPFPKFSGHRDVEHLVCAGGALTLNGTKLDRHGGKRLEDYLEKSFILFGNAHQLYYLGEPSKSKSNDYEFLRNGFGFDLIIVDEASQLPTDNFLASIALVKQGQATLRFSGGDNGDWPSRSQAKLNSLALAAPLELNDLTKVVVVGDDNQLPPVQPIKPPKHLQIVIDSLFRYLVDGHKVKHHQLRVNYRSDPVLVEYTRRLGIYHEGLEAFHEENPFRPLPVAPQGSEAWLRDLLAPGEVVGALIHSREYETAVSPFESLLVAKITTTFFQQMKVSNKEEELHFWKEHLGIVSPHNAQGRLITRRIFESLTTGNRQTFLSDEELMNCLRSTIYSVEKFQGSDRTFIIGSFGISSRDQLIAEEEFIYNLNRFNVLTSRAKQKMLLICSKNYLDYIPRDRDVMVYASRIRDYAMTFCSEETTLNLENEKGDLEHVVWRRHPKANELEQTPVLPTKEPEKSPLSSRAQKLFSLVSNTPEAYYRLIVVVGSPGAGKTRLLQEVARAKGWSLLNLNLQLSARLLELTQKQRALKTASIFSELISEAPGEVVLLDNVEIIFNPALRQDALKLLQQSARNKTVVVAWSGEFSGNMLSYAIPSHFEFKKYENPTAIIVEL